MTGLGGEDGRNVSMIAWVIISEEWNQTFISAVQQRKIQTTVRLSNAAPIQNTFFLLTVTYQLMKKSNFFFLLGLKITFMLLLLPSRTKNNFNFSLPLLPLGQADEKLLI